MGLGVVVAAQGEEEVKKQSEAPRMVGYYTNTCTICERPLVGHLYSTNVLRVSTSCICYSKTQAGVTKEQWQVLQNKFDGRKLTPLPLIDQYTCWYVLGGDQ